MTPLFLSFHFQKRKRLFISFAVLLLHSCSFKNLQTDAAKNIHISRFKLFYVCDSVSTRTRIGQDEVEGYASFHYHFPSKTLNKQTARAMLGVSQCLEQIPAARHSQTKPDEVDWRLMLKVVNPSSRQAETYVFDQTAELCWYNGTMFSLNSETKWDAFKQLKQSLENECSRRTR